MKCFFIIPPVLVGLTTYIALRRLAYQPMRMWLLPYVAGLTAVVGVQIGRIFLTPGGLGPEARPWIVPIAIALFIVFLPMVVTPFALMFRPQSTARKVSTWAGALGLVGFLAFYFALPVVTKPAALGWVLSVLWPNMNTLVFLPMFGILTAGMGTRRRYSWYEYLFNEGYQRGKCHTVFPATKVEDNDLGGLNLVYNTFKKQPDGVPLWM